MRSHGVRHHVHEGVRRRNVDSGHPRRHDADRRRFARRRQVPRRSPRRFHLVRFHARRDDVQRRWRLGQLQEVHRKRKGVRRQEV